MAAIPERKFNVSTTYVKKAVLLPEQAPDLATRVEEGEMSIMPAIRELEAREVMAPPPHLHGGVQAQPDHREQHPLLRRRAVGGPCPDGVLAPRQLPHLLLEVRQQSTAETSQMKGQNCATTIYRL